MGTMQQRVELLVCLALAGTVAACGDDPEPARSARPPAAGLTTLRDDRVGLTVSFPSSWRRAERTLTPYLTDPVEVLTVGTASLPANTARARCAQHPTAALERMGPADVLLTLQERRFSRTTADPAGPPRVDRAAADRSEARACLGRNAPIRTHWMPFRLSGRSFYAMAAVGDRATAQRRRALQAVLSSLRVGARRIEDDRQRGLRFTRPAGWRRYPFALTQAVQLRHQIALGTFGLEQDEPDANCAPQTAVAARPPGGGLLFVFEYTDLSARQLARLPRRPRRFALARHDPQAYECFGPSHLLRWREQGRAFQAHLYGEGRRLQEALGVLDSFHVRVRQR